jgi:hypothetical protein
VQSRPIANAPVMVLAGVLYQTQGQIHVQLAAVLVHRSGGQQLADMPGLSGLHGPGKAFIVRAPQALWDDHIEARVQDFPRGISEDRLGAVLPDPNPPVGIDEDDAV